MTSHYYGHKAGVGLCGKDGYSTIYKADVNCPACKKRLEKAPEGLSPRPSK